MDNTEKESPISKENADLNMKNLRELQDVIEKILRRGQNTNLPLDTYVSDFVDEIIDLFNKWVENYVPD